MIFNGDDRIERESTKKTDDKKNGIKTMKQYNCV